MADAARLAATLERLDGRGYKAYRDIEGVWRFAESTLFVDRVQSDPFAAPSKLRVRVDAGPFYEVLNNIKVAVPRRVVERGPAARRRRVAAPRRVCWK